MMFGGESLRNPGSLLNDTSRLNVTNTAWSRQTPASSPPARRGHAMVAAQRLGLPVMVVFGGTVAQQQQVADTWVNGGGAWVPRGQGPLPTLPTARTGHAMVTDFLRNEIYLIGGLSGSLPRNDVYRYEPDTDVWSQRLPNGASPTMPPQRRNHCLAYDPGLDKVILFGGQGFAGSLNDTWAYDPVANTWTNLNPATPPPARGESAMSYLLGFGVVLFGGKNPALPAGQQVLGDTWVFNGPTSPGNWALQTLATSPAPRFGHAMSPDQLANNLVLLGGSDGNGAPIPGTWLWNGGLWLDRLPAPAPRDGVATAFDMQRSRHLAFGGRRISNQSDLADTWEFDGLNWTDRNALPAPSARRDAGMAYDSTRNRTVLYGGRSGAGAESGDTWEWLGSSWILRTFGTNPTPPAAGGVQPVFDSKRGITWMLVNGTMWAYDGAGWSPRYPGPRDRGGSCFDSVRNRLVVFGGVNSTASTDTWEWDNTRWYRMSTPVVPPFRYQHAMTFDTVRGVTLMGGGESGAVAPRLTDYWTWNGVTWAPSPGVVPARSHTQMVFDVARGKAVIAAGYGDGPTWLSDTRLWDGATWTPNAGSGLPGALTAPALSYDPVRQVVVLFGGNDQSNVSTTDTWEFDGVNWTRFVRAVAPSPRYYAGLAYDQTSNRTMLFGGAFLPSGSSDQTWFWDGVSWVQATPPGPRPSDRVSSYSLVAAFGRPVLYGGYGGSPVTVLSDLWDWTGSSWRLLSSGVPPTLTNYGAAYDSRRDRVVVFGGMTTNDPQTAAFSDETWEWDGAAWLKRAPVTSPSPRGRSRLCYDEARSRVILFGGIDGQNNVWRDTWEWDGNNWISVSPTVQPPASSDHGLSYDAARHLSILFGRVGTWDFGPLSPAAAVPFPSVWPSPSSCVSTAGAIRLQPLAWSGPWLGERFEVDFQNRPANSLGIFLWGFSNTAWNLLPLPVSLAQLNVSSPCNLLVAPFLSELLLATRYQSFVLPTDPILLSASMFVQAGFFDNTPQGTQIITSNALALTFGQK